MKPFEWNKVVEINEKVTLKKERWSFGLDSVFAFAFSTGVKAFFVILLLPTFAGAVSMQRQKAKEAQRQRESMCSIEWNTSLLCCYIKPTSVCIKKIAVISLQRFKRLAWNDVTLFLSDVQY